jgi:5'-3' exonuclease
MTYDNIVVDCYLVAYGSWWPVREMHTEAGVATGLEFGFIKNILATARRWTPGKVVLAWDGFPKRCNTIFPKEVVEGKEVGYKSGRARHEDKDTEPAWTPRLVRLREAFTPLVECLYHPETEADEEIARFVHESEAKGQTTIIVSKDRDLHQLVSDKTHICLGPEENLMTPENLTKEKGMPWGVPTKKIPLRRAIEGDGSDAIVGIPRIPKEVIVNIVNASESIDHLIENISKGSFTKTATQLEKMINGRDIIRRNYSLAELASQAQYPPNRISTTLGDNTKLIEMVEELECNSLRERKEWQLFPKGTVQELRTSLT